MNCKQFFTNSFMQITIQHFLKSLSHKVCKNKILKSFLANFLTIITKQQKVSVIPSSPLKGEGLTGKLTPYLFELLVTEGAQNTKSAQLTQSKIACSSTLRLSANKPWSGTDKLCKCKAESGLSLQLAANFKNISQQE